MKKDRLITAWSSFPHLKTAHELEQYLEIRLKGHSNYFHYTSLGAINGILQDGFCISSVDRFNDQLEKDVFAGAEKKYYSLCFSTGLQENLALWYLYSGVDGKGGRLQFSYKTIQKMLHGPFKLVEYDYDSHKLIGEIASLTNDNASFCFGDVMYADPSKKNSGKMDLKYNTMTNHELFTAKEWAEFRNSHKGFQKSLIWYYEKETRLLIELSDALYQSLDSEKNYAVLMTIPKEVLRYTKVRLAPKIESLDDKEIENWANISALKRYKSRLQLSEHYGTVNIDLCRKCRRKT